MAYLKPTAEEAMVTIRIKCDKKYNGSYPDCVDSREWYYKVLDETMMTFCDRLRDDKFVIEITEDVVDYYNQVVNDRGLVHNSHKSAQALAKMMRVRRVGFLREQLAPMYEDLQIIIDEKRGC